MMRDLHEMRDLQVRQRDFIYNELLSETTAAEAVQCELGALVENVGLRLQILRQLQCQAALERLEALENPAVDSLLCRIHSDSPGLGHATTAFQEFVRVVERLRNREAHVKHKTLNDHLCAHFESVLRTMRDSRRAVDKCGKPVNYSQHSGTVQVIRGKTLALQKVRTDHLGHYNANKELHSNKRAPGCFEVFPCKAQLCDYEAHTIMKNDVEQSAWHEAAHRAMLWRLEQRLTQDKWLNSTSAILRDNYSVAALQLQDELTTVREVLGDLKALRPVLSQSGPASDPNETCVKYVQNVDNDTAGHLQKAQIILLDALAKCLCLEPAVWIDLYIDLLPMGDRETGFKRLLFDLQCQCQHQRPNGTARNKVATGSGPM